MFGQFLQVRIGEGRSEGTNAADVAQQDSVPFQDISRHIISLQGDDMVIITGPDVIDGREKNPISQNWSADAYHRDIVLTFQEVMKHLGGFCNKGEVNTLHLL